MSDSTAQQYSTPRRQRIRHVHYDLDADDGEDGDVDDDAGGDGYVEDDGEDEEMEYEGQYEIEDVDLQDQNEVSSSLNLYYLPVDLISLRSRRARTIKMYATCPLPSALDLELTRSRWRANVTTMKPRGCIWRTQTRTSWRTY